MESLKTQFIEAVQIQSSSLMDLLFTLMNKQKMPLFIGQTQLAIQASDGTQYFQGLGVKESFYIEGLTTRSIQL